MVVSIRVWDPPQGALTALSSFPHRRRFIRHVALYAVHDYLSSEQGALVRIFRCLVGLQLGRLTNRFLISDAARYFLRLWRSRVRAVP